MSNSYSADFLFSNRAHIAVKLLMISVLNVIAQGNFVKDVKTSVKQDFDYYKNEKGRWTKWVLERCDETQKVAYYEFELLLEQSGYNYIDQDEILRVLNHHKFKDYDKALTTIAESQQWKKTNHVRLGNEHLIPYDMATQAITVQGQDLEGRATIILRPGLYFPECTTPENFNTYSGIMIEKAISQLTHNVDRYNIIMDMENFGFQNFEITTLMATSKDLNKVYLNRIKKIFVVNSNWLLGTFMALSKPFMHPATKEKIIFVDDLSDIYNYQEYLSQFFSREQIPSDYGGKGGFLPQPKQKETDALCKSSGGSFGSSKKQGEDDDDDYDEADDY